MTDRRQKVEAEPAEVPEEAYRVLGKDDEGWFLKDPIPMRPDGRYDLGNMYLLLERAFELAGPSVRELRFRYEGLPEGPCYVHRTENGVSFGRTATPGEDDHAGASS